MNITIKLTSAQVKGYKDYLKDVDGMEKPTKKDIEFEVKNLLFCYIEADAVNDYIKKYENN